MVESWRSLKAPKWVAWYLDVINCSNMVVLWMGLSFRFASSLASFLTSFVMKVRCSLKSRTMLMRTPSIFFYLLGGRYLISEPSGNVIVLIRSCSVVRFLLLRGFPRAHRAPVVSHLVVSSWSNVYELKRCSFLIWILRYVMVPVVMLISSAYPWSS